MVDGSRYGDTDDGWLRPKILIFGLKPIYALGLARWPLVTLIDGGRK
jgi:hypothetical protein